MRWASSGRRPFSASTTGRSAATAAGSIRARAIISASTARLVSSGSRVGVRQVQHIDGVGGVGAGVGIAAEARAQLLPDLARPPVRIVLGAAEQHMFEEMRPAALVVALVQRAGVDPDPDRDLPRRQRVAPHRIAKPVGQRPEPPGRIAGDVGAAIEPVLVAPLGERGGGDEQEQKARNAARKEVMRRFLGEGMAKCRVSARSGLQLDSAGNRAEHKANK